MTTEDLMKLLGDFPEINPSNYGDDEVNALNAWGIAAHTALEALGREVAQLKQKMLDESEAMVSIVQVKYPQALAERDQARAELAAIRATQEPVAYWVPKAEQFCIADKSGRPFAKSWEPLYASPAAKDAGLVESAAWNLLDEVDEVRTARTRREEDWGKLNAADDALRAALTQSQAAWVPDASPKIGGV